MSTQQLIIAGPEPKDQLRWVTVEDGEVRASGVCQNLDDYAETAPENVTGKVTLILPGERFAARQVSTPARSRQQLLQTARFLLEDSIGGQVETLHLAVTQESTGPEKIIIAVETQYARNWIEALKQHDIRLDVMSADFLCLSVEETDTVVLMARNRLLFNMNGTGFVAEREFAEPLVRQILSEDGQMTVKLLLGDNEPEPDWLDNTVEQYRIDDEAALIRFLAANIHRTQPPNILQGALEPSIDWQVLLKPWRHALVLLAASIVLFFTVQLIQAVKFNAAADRITQEATDRFRTTFPELQVRNLRNQARQLAGVADTTRSDFLGLVSTLTQAVQQAGTVELSLLVYEGSGVLTADVQFAAIEDLDNLKESLSREGIIVSEGRTLTPVGNVFTGKLTLRAGS